MHCDICGNSTPEYREYKRWARMCEKHLGVSGAPPCVLNSGHRGPHVSARGEHSTLIWLIASKSSEEDPDIWNTYKQRDAIMAAKRERIRKQND